MSSSLPNYGGSYSKTGIGKDAWGRQKVVQDRTVVHGMFTFSIPVDVWREQSNGVELASFTNATSVDGKLVLKSTATLNHASTLSSVRNARYQPNRGHIYSSSMIFPNATKQGRRDFGMGTKDAGVFFRLVKDATDSRGWKLYAVRRTTIQSVIIETEEEIKNLPPDFDPECGNIYDIQIQWRGVGNYTFFIGNALTGSSIPVHNMGMLNTLTELSTFNPAFPILFEAENLGEEVEIQCGCADISAEGGNANGSTYGGVSVDNDVGEISITGFNNPVIALRSKKTFGAFVNTRDTLALLASAYADNRCMFRIWETRDFSAITDNDQVWRDYGDAHLEFMLYNTPAIGTPMSFDISKARLMFGCRVDQDQTYSTSALFEGRTEIYIHAGDMFIFTMHRETGAGAKAGVSFEFSEEI